MESGRLGGFGRREFLKSAGTALCLGHPALWAQEASKAAPPARAKTNIADALAFPRGPHALPGAFPGAVAEIRAPGVWRGGAPDPAAVAAMFRKGLETLTGRTPEEAFRLLFVPEDVVGIKVNPVGPGLISTRPETVDAIIVWLESSGLPRRNIVIWDRFDTMLKDAGFTADRYPGVRIEGLQTMDEAAAEGRSEDNSRWLGPDGRHVSADRFDPDAFYWADVESEQDDATRNQHVFTGRHSYFGKLVSRELTKIINVPVFKNCGNGISMAAKNLGYGAVCNTSRLHKPLFFDVCVEVLAFPAVRDKLVLNVTDGLRGQYDGGPGPAAAFAWDLGALFLATDPFALDSLCHGLMTAKRREAGVTVNEHPRYTDYFRYAERLGLGVTDPSRVRHTRSDA